MAGGTWITQNKDLPGLYINIKSETPITPAAGQRGTVAMPVDISWGEEGIMEVTADDILTGNSLYKIGLVRTDAKAKLIVEALKFCKKAYIYNINTGGTKATNTIGSITATAKYQGVFGNKITITVKQVGAGRSGKFDVITYIESKEVDRQTVENVNELVSNNYVDFSGDGVPTANAGTALQNGTDGSKDSSFLTKFLKAIKTKKWDTLAGLNLGTSDITTVINFIKQMREDMGIKVQAVLYNPSTNPDYEGIIVTKQGYKAKDYEISAEEFPATIAGMTAGASFITSNTMRTIPDAIEIINEIAEDQLVEELRKGVLALNYNGLNEVVIVRDINSFISFNSNKSYSFSKNRVIRTTDLIANDLKIQFETKYAGKVNNSESDRVRYKATLINYLNSLVKAGALESFDEDAIIVTIGNDIDTVFVSFKIKIIDSMEEIYMEVII